MAPNTGFPSQLNNIDAANDSLSSVPDSAGYSPLITNNRQYEPSASNTKSGLWQKLSLKKKVLALGLLLGIVPVVGVGGFSYFLVQGQIADQVTETRQDITADIARFSSEFMDERFQDLRTFSQLSLFADAKAREATEVADKNAFLQQLVENSPIYEDIAVVNTDGSPIAVSNPDGIPANVSQNDWFQRVEATQDIVWVQPREPNAGDLEFALIGAAPIFDTETGELIYMIRVRLDVQELNRRVAEFATEETEVALIDANDQIFLTNTDAVAENPILATLPDTVSWLDERAPQAEVLSAGGTEQLTVYAPIIQDPDDPQLNWSVVSLVDTSTVFSTSRQLLTAVLLGTGVSVLLVALIATVIATRATLPILQITNSVKRLGKGDFRTRINAQGDDEIAQLGANINHMAAQIQALLAKQEEAVQQQISAQAQAERADEERQRNEVLQRELVQLLNEMEEASNGDLTVRTELTAGEIGIIGDVFNAIIENLRSIVIQVKQATGQVNSSIDESESEIRQLADEALAQMDDITNTLNSVEQMSRSIQDVADNARQAAQVAQVASTAAQDSGTAMDRTVESILDLRSTVAETGKKVKQLGESSQQISQVVSLINEIAMKTNLLAVNASIEAAHAGEEGQGFAVVASEVGQLAEQSASATKEIEQIVKNIQMGTRDVVEAMERGTTQVVEGTRLVQETKQGLGQIVDVSQKIDQLLQSISQATVSQAETSQTVTQLMQQITVASKRTSESSRQVAGTLQNTVEVARELESTVDQFKLQTDA
ncbi:MAG: methyl-accepting chemotaxis protein [Leptolyngbyaceae cyanobacterium]